MNDVAIRVENLSKCYEIDATKRRHATLRDELTEGLKDIFKRNRQHRNKTIWALRNVSFGVQHGEVVGVIGHNGAGKSTLLKILSQITDPTKVTVRFTVGSAHYWRTG